MSNPKWKKFKPKFHEIVQAYIPENTNDMFIDVKVMNNYKELGGIHALLYEGIILGFGKNVFVFDVESCDFLVWVRFVGIEPKMEICKFGEE